MLFPSFTATGLVALLSFGALATSAAPSSATIKDVEKRQAADILGVVTNLQGTVEGLLTKVTSLTAPGGAGLNLLSGTAILGELTSAISGATSSLPTLPIGTTVPTLPIGSDPATTVATTLASVLTTVSSITGALTAIPILGPVVAPLVNSLVTTLLVTLIPTVGGLLGGLNGAGAGGLLGGLVGKLTGAVGGVTGGAGGLGGLGGLGGILGL